MKRVSASTLRRKKNKWQKILNLEEWNIKIKYPCQKDRKRKDILPDDLACMLDCYNDKKTAVIIVNNDYHKCCTNEFLNNIDMIILHELTHVLFNEHIEDFAQHIKENPKVKEFEEYICNVFAVIIYSLKNSKK